MILLALLSGEAGLLYAVISGEKPIYILFLAVLGLLFVTFFFVINKRYKRKCLFKIKWIGERVMQIAGLILATILVAVSIYYFSKISELQK